MEAGDVEKVVGEKKKIIKEMKIIEVIDVEQDNKSEDINDDDEDEEEKHPTNINDSSDCKSRPGSGNSSSDAQYSKIIVTTDSMMHNQSNLQLLNNCS